jgi:hypothetical protein
MERYVESNGSGTLPMRTRGRVLGRNDMSERTRAPRRSKSLGRDDRLPCDNSGDDAKFHGPRRAIPNGPDSRVQRSHRTEPKRGGQTDCLAGVAPKSGKAVAPCAKGEDPASRSFTLEQCLDR